MNAALGLAGVTLGMVASVVGAIMLVIGLVRHRPEYLRLGRAAAGAVLAGAVLAFAAMERALITRDFSLAYVAKVGSSLTPPLFNVASLWSALEGSILLWVLVLSGYLFLVAHHFRRRLTDPLVAWALVTMLVVAAFFFAVMLGPANPFKEVAGVIPADGPGPNPLLQNHILMAIHPPVLYLGYVGFTVPFAFAVAALITGRVGEGWLVETRRWTLFAWGFLTVGIILGAWWSYEVLGWGGYWAWDPVENASFLPWLTATAFIHSVMVQERRGMLRVWNLSLLCATFSLTILGTFLTRSGVLDSVHAFTESGIGTWFLSGFGVVVAVSVGLIGWRGDRLRSPGSIDSPLSREASFLANNVLFAGFAFAVLLGTVFPLVIEAVNGDRLSVGRPYFDQMTVPIGLALLTLMAIAPVLPWRKASGELLRQRLLWPAVAGVVTAAVGVAAGLSGWAPALGFFLGGFAGGSALRQVVLATRRQGWRGLVGRANGGMIVHLGVVVIAVALSASGSFAKSGEFSLRPGESARIDGHTITYQGLEETDDGRKVEIRAQVAIDGGQTYAPGLQRFPNATQPIGVPSVRSRPLYDVYLTLLPPLPDDVETGPVRIRVLIMPLASWLWTGGGIMAFGTVLAAFPGRRRRRPTDPVSAPVPAAVGDNPPPGEVDRRVEVLTP